MAEFNAKQQLPGLLDWMRAQMKACGGKTAVIGISGGKDSSVTAALSVAAYGRENVVGVLMPDGVQPDIVSTAKGLAGGLPLGATLFSEKTKDVLTPGSHGSTFGGNPICCAGAINILSRLDEKTLAGVRERSEYIFSELSGAPGIKEVSGLGLMIGIKTEKDASEVINTCMKKGVLVIKAKDKVRLLPALNIPMELLEQAVGVIKEVCADKEA